MQRYLIFSEDEIYVVDAVIAKDAVQTLLSYWNVTDPLLHKLMNLLELPEFIKVSNRFHENSILGITCIPSTLLYGRAEGGNVTLLTNDVVCKDTLKVKSSNLLKSGELALINAFSNKMLGPEDVFVFSVKLCDNDIDSNFDQLTSSCLYRLSDMFVGKTGMIRISDDIESAIPRIISCEVVETDKLTKSGDKLLELIGRVYLERSENNKVYIDMIDSGKLQNVNTGFACYDQRCNICGKPIFACKHKKGENYNVCRSHVIRQCVAELDNPSDVYEFSIEA